jgi:hypothetical protein
MAAVRRLTRSERSAFEHSLAAAKGAAEPCLATLERICVDDLLPSIGDDLHPTVAQRWVQWLSDELLSRLDHATGSA